MSQCPPHGDRIPQNSIEPQVRLLSVFFAIALTLFLSAPAQAGSVTASLQIRAQVVNSCRVSTESLLNSTTGTQGRLNCPTGSEPSSSSSTAARTPQANYSITDVPGTDGTKIATFNF